VPESLGAARVSTDGWRFRSPGQQWWVDFDGTGFVTRPDAHDWTWGLRLQRYGLAGQEPVAVHQARVVAEGNRLSYGWDTTLEEWFINDARGLEHGFTVRERPASKAGYERGENGDTEAPLAITLEVLGGLVPEIADQGREVRFVDGDGCTALTYGGLTVFDADGRTVPARIERVSGDLVLIVEDSRARYPLTIDPIAQQAYLKASNTDAGDDFGWSMSVSGDTIVVGASGEDSAATGVNGDQTDNSADYAAGAAYVFERTGTTWTQQAYLKASNTDSALTTVDGFGSSVSISGNTVVIGAPREQSGATGVNGDQSDNSHVDAGAAYVFERSGTTWTQQAYLKASNTDAYDGFSRSVSISGDTVVVGAWKEASAATGINGNQTDNSALDAGAAYVFVRSGSTWTQQVYLKASNTEAGDRFGSPVCIWGDTAVVGARSEASAATGVDGNQSDNSAASAGASYVFELCGSISSYGSGCQGSGGFVPSLDLVECALPGSSVRIDVAGGLGGAPSFLFVGSGQTSVPVGGGCRFLLLPPFSLIGPIPLAGAGPGNGSISIDTTVPPTAPLGSSGTLQLFVSDLGGNPIGYAGSNGVEIVVE